VTTPRRFSDRNGITQVPRPTPQEAPESLRYFLYKLLEVEHHKYPYSAALVLENFLRKPGLANQYANRHNPELWPRIYRLILDLDWWQIYNLIEYLSNSNDGPIGKYEFAHRLNELFTSENIPYRLDVSGLIVYHGSEGFELSVSSAVAILETTGRNTAASEIQEALNDLARRPNQDLTGAVQHAIAGLECIAKEVCGSKGGTLGNIAKRNPQHFPPPLDEAINKLYGFASERGRHLNEGGEPELRQVELIVGIAANVITYLAKCSPDTFTPEEKSE
jgi:hypothetical protein